MGTVELDKNLAHDKKDAAGCDAGARDTILKVAEQLFIEKGFDGVSVKDIAVRAGVAKALVFYYFKTKQELFDTVLDDYYVAQTKELMTALGSGASPRDRILASADAYMDFIERNPGYARLIQREVCSRSENLEKVLEYLTPMYRWGLVVFGDLFAGGGPLAAKHFFISFFGMTINYYTYTPVIERLWGEPPMGPEALAERRRHILMTVEALMDVFIKDGARNADSPAEARPENNSGV